ncbi:pro-resilin-like [Anabrus simplex]|uniref:pro-resilin-like n=1 Tax=Anabrus simplex TaxID=316456 RepID=UPI0035A360B2
MAKMLLVLGAVALATVMAEPPVGRQYLPPGQGNGYGSRSAPSSRYGAPSASSGRFMGSPSSQYGAPFMSQARSNGGFGGSNGFGAAPSTQYGAPSGRSNGFGGSFSAASGRLSGGNGFRSAPSAQYGAPSAFSGGNGFGRTSGLSSSYNAPGASARLGGAPAPVYGPPNGGYNYDDARARLAQDDLSEPANYEFSYEVQDADSGSDFGHQESRQDDTAQGEYRVLLPDGRTQIVEYEADQEGYRPMIRYEESNGGYAQGRGQGPY